MASIMMENYALQNRTWFPPLRGATKLLNLLASLGLVSRDCEIPVWAKNLQHKFFIRPLSSDISALSQIFIGDEFGSMPIETPHYCLDLGANIGCTSIYFLNRWPDSRVIAVEADPVNFQLLVKNLRPYGNRALPVLGAVSDFNGHVSIERSPLGHWASQITSVIDSNQPIIPAFTLDRILAWCPPASVDLIKMDIEGAETRVIAWMINNLEHCRGSTLAVELHNQEAHNHFRSLAKLVDSNAVSIYGEYHSIVLPIL